MSRVLPILFNTEMVRAILDSRKTVTRRVVKGNVDGILNSPYRNRDSGTPDNVLIGKLCKPPYQTGDILYVRETWSFLPCAECMDEGPSCTVNPVVYDDGDCEAEGCFVYKASHPRPERVRWTPSIHMPKQAARIWLKVKDVRVERLQDMTGQDILREGVNCHVHPEAHYFDGNQKMMFAELWDSTVRKPDLKSCGWDANPWVWVIEFERCEKPKGDGKNETD